MKLSVSNAIFVLATVLFASAVQIGAGGAAPTDFERDLYGYYKPQKPKAKYWGCSFKCVGIKALEKSCKYVDKDGKVKKKWWLTTSSKCGGKKKKKNKEKNSSCKKDRKKCKRRCDRRRLLDLGADDMDLLNVEEGQMHRDLGSCKKKCKKKYDC